MAITLPSSYGPLWAPRRVVRAIGMILGGAALVLCAGADEPGKKAAEAEAPPEWQAGFDALYRLAELLAEVGGARVRLGYTVEDGVDTVSTVTALARNTLTRVYDIRRAIKGEASRAQDVAAIVTRIRGIDPLSWKDAGGDVGAIRELQGQLIVTQTPDVQRRIAEELRDVLPPDAQAWPLEPVEPDSSAQPESAAPAGGEAGRGE